MKPQLLLIPTELERARIEPALLNEWCTRGNRIELCGFGLVAASARTMQLVCGHECMSVTLLGIAGSLRESTAPVGSAVRFRSVACYGIGVGSGSTHRTAGQMGWAMWPNPPTIEDCIGLDSRLDTRSDTSLDTGSIVGSSSSSHPMLLSVAAASESHEDADWKRHSFPDAVAEDMEGFAVATVCRFMNIPLTIIRGISNLAGDREHKRWKIDESLDRAMRLVLNTEA